MPYVKKARKTQKPKNPKRVYKKRIQPRKNMVKMVQSIINKNLEDKEAFRSVTDINLNSGISIASDLMQILPNINIGTGDASRVGQQLTVKRLTISGHMITNLTHNTYSDCRIGVRMMIVTPKGYAGREPAVANAPTWLGQLLKRGSTSVGFTGLVQDYYSPINTDVITCYYDKKFYVRTPYVPATVTGDFSVSASTRFFRIPLKVTRKVLKYDSAVDSGLTPTHYNPFLILGYCHLDSSAPDTTQTQINLSFISQLDYQDA